MPLQNCPIKDLPGLSASAQQQLADLGISTTLELLQRGQSQFQRNALAQSLTLHVKYVNKWVALANLASIPGVGSQYCGLLLHAGVSSPQQLAHMPVPQIHRQIQRLHVQLLSRTEQCPGLELVAQWVYYAKMMTA